MEWIKPPFLNDDGSFRESSCEDSPEGDWPWCDDYFLAAVMVSVGRWEYAVVCFTETGLECDGHSWGWSAEDIVWIAKLTTPRK
jgi:hypothetical protein